VGGSLASAQSCGEAGGDAREGVRHKGRVAKEA
jgi:hypothetical protein